jgi:hypothetical protein
MNQRTTESLNRDVRDRQMKPVAGIWECPSCGRHIQVLTDSDVAQKSPFRCVCGTDMEPGESHTEIDTNRAPDGP